MLVNIHDAKTHFSKFIKQALKGDEVIIARDGKPLIRLVPYTEEPQIRKGGQFQGLIQMSEDFDAPLPQEVLKQFYGDEK
jgi:prevent-host-death family protein